MDAIQYTLPAVKKSLLMSDRVERDESSYNKGTVYCTQNFIFHSIVHSSRVIRDTCTMYVHVQCMPTRVQGSRIHWPQVPESPSPGSLGLRSPVLGSTEYSIPTVSGLPLNSTAHTIIIWIVCVGWWCDYVYYGLFSKAFVGKYIQVHGTVWWERLGRLGLHLYHLPQITLRSV